MERKNYFVEVNPNYIDEDFKLCDRKDPDTDSKTLISDLMNTFINNKETPSGYKFEVACIDEATTNKNKHSKKRWYAKVRVKDSNDKYYCTFGLTSDYIGASIHWAEVAGLNKDEIIEHLMTSRTLKGHIIFPTWYTSQYGTSWELYPDGISINMARGGENGYYDRFDYTLYAIKLGYENPKKKTVLSDMIKRNAKWFKLFVDFKGFIKWFGLDSLVDEDYNVYDITSFDSDKNKYTSIITSDYDKSTIVLPEDKQEYMKYIQGCEYFINNK